MMLVCDSYFEEAAREFRTVAVQSVGIVFLGNFSGMVTGLVLSPPQSTNIPKVIGGSLIGGLVGIAIALSLISRKTREFTKK